MYSSEQGGDLQAAVIAAGNQNPNAFFDFELPDFEDFGLIPEVGDGAGDMGEMNLIGANAGFGPMLVRAVSTVIRHRTDSSLASLFPLFVLLTPEFSPRGLRGRGHTHYTRA